MTFLTLTFVVAIFGAGTLVNMGGCCPVYALPADLKAELPKPPFPVVFR